MAKERREPNFYTDHERLLYRIATKAQIWDALVDAIALQVDPKSPEKVIAENRHIEPLSTAIVKARQQEAV